MDDTIHRWLITDAFPHIVYCSNCYMRYAQTNWSVWEDGTLPRNYCPNCGVKMKTIDYKPKSEERDEHA